MDLFARACGARPPRRHAPYALAYYTGLLCEAHGRLTGRVKPPLATRYAVWLMGRHLEYSTEKARTRLGWTPALTYEQSIARTVAWFLEQERRRNAPGTAVAS
jgi:nucleoside-diphosphate-sugar epimerase